ncbi:hypothetical protein, partial [Cypionkella psychrotolerans]|uniref:hypothetical protein n=1 Tax=Cypionkella psychrotolerans TaxID=1678131 RepID=UPI001C06E700
NNVDADAPKPPTYPFNSYQFQRARTQNKQNARTSGACRRVSKFRHERFISLPSAPRPHRCVCFASVRRCLGLVAESRKRKNAHLRHFLVMLNVYRGFSQVMLLRWAASAKSKGANPGLTPNLRL